MILNNNFKSIEIDITTYKKNQHHKNIFNIMNENLTEKANRKSNQNRFICSICLNKKSSQHETESIECCKRKSKSCPICQRNCDENKNAQNGHKNSPDKREHENICRAPPEKTDVNDKNTYIQTSQLDVTQGLTLLNEVLTVFQSKKQLDCKKNNIVKTVILKDASVSTDVTRKPKLVVSKTFLYSLGENDPKQKNGKFTIINCQPETAKISQFSIDLIKHKSSSIPQMKLEELKSSFKDKTKSKDAIEEVNRMFATVRKYELRENQDNCNRPMIRNGPRVLPVVKTNTHYTDNAVQRQDVQNCRCCQIGYHMSSGDSFLKHGCCYKPDRYDDCYVSCRYKQHRCMNANNCEHCCNSSKECKQTVEVQEE